MDSPEDIVAAYQLLYVVEERALSDFGFLAEVLDETGDPETASLFRTIAKDEARHLRYCAAIGRRYADDEAGWRAGVDHLRQIEAEFYDEHGRMMLEIMVAEGLFSQRGGVGWLVSVAMSVESWFSPGRGEVRLAA